ncbi:ArsR/SmtB family transcription factor [Amycolatopsis azurea]|uniref:Transcriptional regulator n=1 Tax=Amycolatopsis azurea DSM 43854 TaxID=1238180 RepID=M2QT65_9PSEU|nr:metalloregulator ArsR/SmtB family transcription factor [Amycolatopsis azurea]EMD29202.1 Transcriptional regulator, ArsR family [Amycolatopsis azurea DSM 43854]OOC01948.1 transcriptional regulator [Amycolatopsis azurea DSM 43854]
MYAHDDTGDQWGALPDPGQIEIASTAMRMLSDPTRMRMMWLLSGTEYDVNSLAAAVDMARPAVSQQLAKLKLAGLVSVRRDGRRALYSTRGGHVRRLLTEALNAAEHHLYDLPDHD